MLPEVKYANSNGVSIAYQSFGQEAPCLIVVLGWVSNVDQSWKNPWTVNWFKRLATFSRVINFDKRGVGLSDRVSQEHLPGIDQRMDDLRAIMDAEGIEKAFIFGISEGGPLAALFASTYPERTLGLMIYGSYPKWVNSEDYPHSISREMHERSMEEVRQNWSRGPGFNLFAPSVADDPMARAQWANYLRQSASPGSAIALYKMNMEIDVRDILPTIKVPALILHRKDDKLIRMANARYFAYHIPGAKLIELDGADHLAWHGDIVPLLDAVETFVTKTPVTKATASSSLNALLMFTGNVVNEAGIASLEKAGGKLIYHQSEVAMATFKGAEKALRWACIQHTGKKGNDMAALIDVLEMDADAHRPDELVATLQPLLQQGKVLATEHTHRIVIDPGFEISPTGNEGLYEVSLAGLQTQTSSTLRNEDVQTLLEVRRYLNEHYSQPITLKTLVKEFRLNDFKLKTGFKELFGTTFKKYLDERRMRQACELLKSTDLTVQDIADQVGFGHYTNFIQAFKKHLNQTPLQYRKENTLKLSV